MTTQDIKREARQLGIAWDRVKATYAEIKASEQAKREHANEVRSTAWMLANASSPGCWPFWRHGFAARYGRKIAQGHDYTIVPGYDEIGQEIGTVFPEYADDDGTERLWDFLFSPYDRMPAAAELYAKALDYVTKQKTWAEPELVGLPDF